jgi:uncharacterized protein (DUF2141 family)
VAARERPFAPRPGAARACLAVLLALLAGLAVTARSACALDGLQLAAGDSGRRDIVLIVRNVRDGGGKVRMALWDRAEVFTKSRHKIAGEKLPAEPGEVRFVVPDMPDGRYAAAVYHDANDNGEMDRTWIGLPSEGLGFSNGARIHYDIFDPGPPTFDEASIAIDESNNMIIVNLEY